MKTLFVDSRISYEEYNNLKQFSTNILKVPTCNNLYEAIKGHPDILMHIVDDKTIIVHRNMPKDFITKLHFLNFKTILSNILLKNNYPLDIPLNGVTLPNYFIHNLKYTDKTLLNYNINKVLIDVKQGYTKCSLAIVNNNSFITSDVPMAKTLKQHNFNVLWIPNGDIILEGLNYGFIGGTCGLIENGLLGFFGELSSYKYGKDILDFLKSCKVEPFFLKKGKLVDRGSILSV